MNLLKASLVLILLILFSTHILPQNEIIMGRSIQVYSEVLKENRNILVYLPRTYLNSSEKYPVIYLLDAENNFTYTAGLVDFLTRLGRMPESVIVGITNTNRNRDFTPTLSAELPASGGADNFLRFLKEELIPHIEKNYRTEAYKTLIGHSLCGMFSFYTMLTSPDLFNSFIAISPWFIYNNNFMLGFSETAFEIFSTLNKFIYFTAGSIEQPDVVASMDRYTDLLKKKAPADLRWEYKLMEGDDHTSLLPSTIQEGLKKLFDGWRVPDSVLRRGLESIIDHFNGLSEEFGYRVNPSEGFLNVAGYFFLQRNNFEDALKIFSKNVELYPESSNVYDSRGEAFERSGQLKKAKENYAKACEIAEKNNDPNLSIFRNNSNRVNNLMRN